jgi:hypothetical protein
MAAIAFLMLSEDELGLRARRWISADTWKLSRVGMAARLDRFEPAPARKRRPWQGR